MDFYAARSTSCRLICGLASRAPFSWQHSIGAALFLLMFLALCIEAVRSHIFASNELGLPIALAIIGVLTFFSIHIAWRLWRGSLSSNGVTLMPTWFIQAFGVFFLAGIAFVAYHNPTYPLLAEGVSVALAMVFFGRNLAKRKREIDHETNLSPEPSAGETLSSATRSTPPGGDGSPRGR